MVVSENIFTHPKIVKAAQRLDCHSSCSPATSYASSRVIHLFLLGIAYARQHMTDGFIPDTYLTHCSHISDAYLTAEALSARGIRLWRKVKGGYRIHDYHAYNPSAREEKTKREKWRLAKAQQRRRNGNGKHTES